MKYIFIWKSTVLSILFAFDFWRPVFNIRSPITIWHRHFCGLQAFLPSSPSFPSLPSPPSFPSNNPHTLLKYLPSFLLFQENPIALTTPGGGSGASKANPIPRTSDGCRGQHVAQLVWGGVFKGTWERLIIAKILCSVGHNLFIRYHNIVPTDLIVTFPTRS